MPSGCTGIIEQDVTKGAVVRCFANIVVMHQLLHSQRNTVNQWIEHDVEGMEEILEGCIVYADISGYNEKNIDNILRKLYVKILQDYYPKEVVPHRLCCVKTGGKTFQYIWGFDHSAFDGMSAEIIKGNVEEGLLRENKSRHSIRSYSSYAELLEMSPDIQPYEIIQEFELRDWSMANRALLLAIESDDVQRDSKSYTLSIPLHDLEGRDIWEAAFDICARLLSQYSGMLRVPLTMLDYGREYRGERFHDSVGEFLDFIPIFAGDQKRVERLTNLCKNKGLNFLSLIFGKDSKESAEIYELLAPSLIEFDSIPKTVFYNFQGYAEQFEKNAFDKTEDKPIAAGMICVNFDQTDLCIEITFECGINVEKFDSVVRAMKERGWCYE
jgi:surfactin family lipopeptide synthetase A